MGVDDSNILFTYFTYHVTIITTMRKRMHSKHIQNQIRLIGMLLAALVLAACAVPLTPTTTETGAVTTADDANDADAPEAITVTHAQGETEVPVNPETVVVFDYSVLDTLDQLGVPVAALPQSSSLPPFLSEYGSEEYANAGTLFEPDYELVNQLEPDLIIVAGRSSSVYEDLAEIAPTIDLTVDQENFLESFKANMTTLGAIFGQEEEVANRLADIDASIERVNQLAADSGQNALIVLTTGGNVTAYGPGSRFGLIHDLLGVTPVVEDVEAATHGDAISFEFILEHDPDILFIIDRDSAIGQGTEAAEQVMDNELMHQTTAWANDKLVYLDPAVWYLANSGLSTFPAMIAEIEAGLE